MRIDDLGYLCCRTSDYPEERHISSSFYMGKEFNIFINKEVNSYTLSIFKPAIVFEFGPAGKSFFQTGVLAGRLSKQEDVTMWEVLLRALDCIKFTEGDDEYISFISSLMKYCTRLGREAGRSDAKREIRNALGV